MEHPILKHPDWSQSFIVQTDASDKAIGAVLCRLDEEGQERVIQYASRQLSNSERKWDTREKELLRVVWACEAFRPYLIGQHFTVETDHANLCWLFNGSHKNGRLDRWVLRLQEFDFSVKYRPGKANANADCLSRMETDETGEDHPVLTTALLEVPSVETLRDHQYSDPVLSQVIKFVKDPEGQPATADVRDVLKEAGQYEVDELTGLLVYVWQRNGRVGRVPVLPASLRKRVFDVLHSLPLSAHLGRKKTYERIRSQYYWKGMGADIANWVRSCDPCQRRKIRQATATGRMQLFSSAEPFQVVGIDLLGPLPRTTKGNTHVVVMVDRFTRWPELAAVSDITAETVADVFVQKVILRHGCPVQVLSDRGAQFTSRLFKRMAKLLGVKSLMTTAYHPQTNGQVERFNRLIATALTAFVNETQTDWDDFLEFIAFAYRTSVCESIGDTPFHLVCGRDARLPTTVLDEHAPGKSPVVPKDYGEELVQKLQEQQRTVRRKLIGGGSSTMIVDMCQWISRLGNWSCFIPR